MALTPQSAGRELAQLRSLPYGAARTAAVEALARRVEAEGPAEKLPEALLDLVEAYCFHGEGSNAFEPFAQLLRLWDTSPELFDDADRHNLFWEFKWVASDVSDYPELSVAQVDEFFRDMERRFDLAGWGRSAAADAEFRWAWARGDADAEAARLRWLALPKDGMDPCRACRVGKQVTFFVETGRDDEAIELGQTQQDACNLEPARTFAALALAYLNRGDGTRAVAAHRRMLATIDTPGNDFAAAHGQEFELLARGGEIDRALSRLRNRFPALLHKAGSPLGRLRFLLGLLAGLSANLDRSDTATGLAEPELATLGGLHAWVKREAKALATRFDARDSNDYYARWLARALSARLAAAALVFDVDASEPASADGLAAPADDAADGEPGGESLLVQARLADEEGDQARSAVLHAAVAKAAEAAGMLKDAGMAWGSSAYGAAMVGDDHLAHARFARAVSLLRAADASDDIVADVLAAWAQVAVKLDDSGAVLDELEAAIDRTASVDASALAAEPAQTRTRDMGVVHARLQAIFAETLAAPTAQPRLPGRELVDAIQASVGAGVQFAQLGLVTSAASVLLLAGRLQRDQGDTVGAEWALESAFEGYSLMGKQAERAEAAGELIDVLRATGQFVKADEVIASLSQR